MKQFIVLCVVVLVGVVFAPEAKCSDVEISKWESVRSHGGGLGNMAIELHKTATCSSATVECRIGTVRQIDVTLDTIITENDVTTPIVATGECGDCDDATASGFSVDGYVLTITFADGDIEDECCYQIDLNGVIDDLTGDTNVFFRTCAGDGDNDGEVDTSDICVPDTFWSMGTPVCSEIFRFDYNLNGEFDLGDVAYANYWNNSEKSACE